MSQRYYIACFTELRVLARAGAASPETTHASKTASSHTTELLCELLQHGWVHAGETGRQTRRKLAAHTAEARHATRRLRRLLSGLRLGAAAATHTSRRLRTVELARLLASIFVEYSVRLHLERVLHALHHRSKLGAERCRKELLRLINGLTRHGALADQELAGGKRDVVAVVLEDVPEEFILSFETDGSMKPGVAFEMAVKELSGRFGSIEDDLKAVL